MRQYTRKEIFCILKNNGYQIDRYSGSHCIFKDDKGNTISIPKSIKSVVIQRIIKQYNLKEDD